MQVPLDLGEMNQLDQPGLAVERGQPDRLPQRGRRDKQDLAEELDPLDSLECRELRIPSPDQLDARDRRVARDQLE